MTLDRSESEQEELVEDVTYDLPRKSCKIRANGGNIPHHASYFYVKSTWKITLKFTNLENAANKNFINICMLGFLGEKNIQKIS